MPPRIAPAPDSRNPKAPDLSVELPDGLLDIPFKNDRPRIQRFDAGVLLDLHTRRLARLTGAVDRGLALRLRRLRAGRGYLDLGYSDLVAYARERLGLAPRTCHDLARLGEGLERRPLIDAALKAGRITWSAAAAALRGCGHDDEAEWARRAETLTVRELKAEVKLRRESADAVGECAVAELGRVAATGATAVEPDAANSRSGVGAACTVGERRRGDPDVASATSGCATPWNAGGEGTVADSKQRQAEGEDAASGSTVRGADAGVSVSDRRPRPAGGKGAVSGAKERSAGDGGAVSDRRPRPAGGKGAVSDSIVRGADAGGAVATSKERPAGGDRSDADLLPAMEDDVEEDDPVLRLHVLTSGAVARLWDAAVELCGLVAGVPLNEAEAAEYVLADFLSGSPGVPAEEDGRWPTAALDKRLRRSRPLEELVPADEIGDLALPAPYSTEVAAALALVDGPIPDDAHALDASARTLVAARNGVDLDLARLLRNFRSLGLHRHIGFDTFAEYVRERLAISSARAHMLARLDYKLFFLPQTSAAVRNGAIGLVAADLISRVAQPETEAAWIAAAERRTVKRLRQDVEWVQREADRSDWSQKWPPAPDALPSALDMVTAGMRGGPPARSEVPEAWIRVSAEDDWRERAAEDASEWRCNDRFVPARDENGIPFTAEGAALRCQPEIERAFNVDGCPADAPLLQVGDRVLQMFAPHQASAGWVPVRFGLRASALALWNRARWVVAQRQELGLATNGMVLREVAVAFLITHLPLWFEALDGEDPIAVRARFACQMPGCDRWGGAGHHLRYRSQSGPDEAWNLEFLCFDHHIPGVHGGRVRIYGQAPNGLVAELGLRPDGRPLERWVRWGTLLRERWVRKTDAA